MILFSPLMTAVLLLCALSSSRAGEPTHPLAVKQAIIRDRVLRLEDRILKLIESLRAQEPAQAERLESALTKMSALGIRQDLNHLIGQLNDDTSWQSAIDNQDALIVELRALLELLMAEDQPEQLRQEQIATLKATIASVNELLDDEQRLIERTEALSESGNENDDPDIQALQELLDEQHALLAETNEQLNTANEDSHEIASKQLALARESDELASKISREPSDAQLGPAVQSMKEAADSLSKGNLGQASDLQVDAIEDLERALQVLRKKKAPDYQTLTDVADQQTHTAAKTRQLAEQMNKQPQLLGPAQQQVQSANDNMSRASEQLHKSDVGNAQQLQQQAIDALNVAKEQLQAQLDDLMQQALQEKRDAMLAACADMHRQQRAIHQETRQLNDIAPSQWQRQIQLQAIDTARRQELLGDSAKLVMDMLREDGTTTVLPKLMAQVQSSMLEASHRIAQFLVGDETQSVQQDIINSLEDIISVLEQSSSAMTNGNPQEQPPSSQQDGQPQPQPLFPSSVELELLARMQRRVHEQTKTLANETSTHERLSKRQQEVTAMAREMARKLQRSRGAEAP